MDCCSAAISRPLKKKGNIHINLRHYHLFLPFPFSLSIHFTSNIEQRIKEIKKKPENKILPGQPIQVNSISFFNPDKALTKPPLLILQFQPFPSGFFVMVMGNLFEMTIKRDFVLSPIGIGLFGEGFIETVGIPPVHKRGS